jgi:hypothetical protein
MQTLPCTQCSRPLTRTLCLAPPSLGGLAVVCGTARRAPLIAASLCVPLCPLVSRPLPGCVAGAVHPPVPPGQPPGLRPLGQDAGVRRRQAHLSCGTCCPAPACCPRGLCVVVYVARTQVDLCAGAMGAPFSSSSPPPPSSSLLIIFAVNDTTLLWGVGWKLHLSHTRTHTHTCTHLCCSPVSLECCTVSVLF